MTKKLVSEILTMMFVDLTSYTEISSKMDRKSFNEMHNTFDKLCKPIFKEFSGTLIKKIGDAFLVTFKSPTDALLCSIKLQKNFKNYNLTEKPEFPLRIKIALHTGEVLLKKKDIYGDAVNVVSRLASATPTTNIYFTKSVFFAMNKNEIPFSFVGLKRFKGVKLPVHVSKVNWSKPKKKPLAKSLEKIFSISIRALIILAIGFGIYLILKNI